MDKSHLYVMRSSAGGLKIGRSGDPERRRMQLEQAAGGHTITIVAIFPGQGFREQEVLAFVRGRRERGEWVDDSPGNRQMLAQAIGVLFWAKELPNPWHCGPSGESLAELVGAP